MSWTISPKYKDPDYNNVSLLLHGNGTNGSTTITDNSPSPKTVTAFGNAQISTAQSKFGGSSIAFDGTGDYLTLPSTADLSMGSSDFTVELWMWLDSTTTGGRPDNNKTVTLFSTGTSSTNQFSLAIYGNTTTAGLGFELYKASTNFGAQVAASVPLNTWVHVAFTKSGSIFYGFVNGTRYTIGALAGSVFDTGSPKVGGVQPDTYPNWFKGYIDDLRITKGVARYTANFTPPAAPFPDI